MRESEHREFIREQNKSHRESMPKLLAYQELQNLNEAVTFDLSVAYKIIKDSVGLVPEEIKNRMIVFLDEIENNNRRF